MTDNKNNDALYGVGCDVASCKYHGFDNRCFSSCINVESPNAQKKNETFCGTYSPRPTDT